jgi:hypothetical protein
LEATLVHPRRFIPLALLCSLLAAAIAVGAEPAGPFREARHGPARLQRIAGIPVLTLEGSPQEMGQQAGNLLGPALRNLLTRQNELFHGLGLRQPPGVLLGIGGAMQARFPAAQRQELESLAKAAAVDYRLLAFGNVMHDWAQLGCSVLMVDPSRSATEGTLMARNLDFPTFGFLDRYSLVTVCRPQGKRAFAAIGFPGLVGCVSGMNDAGLCIAQLDARSNKDGSPTFDFAGTPLAMCFRRLLEECATVDEAARLLRSLRRTTACNLAVCDPRRVAVFEITPKSVVLREGERGWCACTNHFRSPQLSLAKNCWRYSKLATSAAQPRLGVTDVAAQMHGVNQGDRTMQTMVFEPAALRLRLSLGPCPSSARALAVLELAELLSARPKAER